MALNDSETLPIYDDESGRNPSSGQGTPRHGSVIDLGYGNIISPSARMIFISGNNNTIGDNVYGAALINSSGVTVAGNLSNVTVFNTSGVTVSDPNTVTNQNVITKPTQTISIKKFVALISQSGTNAPTQIILENGLGDVPIWSRTSNGFYILTLSGAFILNKTYAVFYNKDVAATSGTIIKTNIVQVDIDSFNVYTVRGSGGALVDGVFSDTPLEIRVYS